MSASSAGGEGATPEESGDGRDPLLVRPFMLPDGEPVAEATPSATWPADPVREIPTQVIPVVPSDPPAAGRSPRRHRPLLVVGAGVVAVLAVALWALLGQGLRPTVSTSLPDQQLPVVSGPVPTASSQPSDGAALGADADNSGGDTGGSRTSPRTTAASKAATTTTATPLPTKPATTGTVAPAPPAELAPSLLENGGKELVSGNGLCLDLRGGDVEEGADVHVDDCNDTSPQRWELNSDRTLAVGDLCAYLEGDGGVELVRCDGRTTAQWALNDDGRLISAANGRCLADPNFGARPGNPVIVTFCTGAANQKWTFR
ncbi:ricin-type beta-trefoil lectin domain protein [Actinoplanes sp. GCM10030250]|uniref:ricin-type beta-trefoil lectin domain protein n=1 Tax=Actinoplanes sp. GCM10030250 TaxID=3273376 RepID=UPI003619009F